LWVNFVEYAVAENYPILILDSTSPEWEGKMGCLELHKQAGGRYQDWDKVTPRHDAFIASIADSQIHIIATMRGKDQYEMEKDGNKTSVKKLGVGAKQREGFEYEFTATFLIDQKTNMSEVQKDNTHLFENEGNLLLTEKHGVQIIQWANSGEGFTPSLRNTKTETKAESLETLRKSIIDLAKELGGVEKEDVKEVSKKHGNPNGIKDEQKLKEYLTDMQSVKTNRENRENK